jgi:hypothetical protein
MISWFLGLYSRDGMNELRLNIYLFGLPSFTSFGTSAAFPDPRSGSFRGTLLAD